MGGYVRRAFQGKLPVSYTHLDVYKRQLFDFIRYIELIDKNNAKIEGENGAVGNGVRIMTIHKSKGLEFPVVFLSGCGGRFNKTD